MKKQKRNWFAYLFVTLLLVFLLMPILSISLYSISMNWTIQMLPEEFTFSYYGELFSMPDFFILL